MGPAIALHMQACALCMLCWHGIEHGASSRSICASTPSNRPTCAWPPGRPQLKNYAELQHAGAWACSMFVINLPKNGTGLNTCCMSLLARAACTVTSHASTSFLMLGAAVLGVFFFYAAGLLSTSSAFRLSCGTTLFTMGSLLILLVLMFRCVHPTHTGMLCAFDWWSLA